MPQESAPELGSKFSDDEISNLKEIFDLFDKEQVGRIACSDLETIMSSLQRDPAEVREFIDAADPSGAGSITFQEFIELMQQVENKIVKQGHAQQPSDQQLQQAVSRGGLINIQADTKVLDFLRLLEEYRRKCEEQGNYSEARKSRAKFEELLRKETQRQKNNIRAAQEQELQNIEAAQKAQFLEFSQAWDNYMSDYEATAYLSLEKLKVRIPI